MTSWLNWTVSERFGRLQLLELIHSIGWGDEFAYTSSLILPVNRRIQRPFLADDTQHVYVRVLKIMVYREQGLNARKSSNFRLSTNPRLDCERRGLQYR